MGGKDGGKRGERRDEKKERRRMRKGKNKRGGGGEILQTGLQSQYLVHAKPALYYLSYCKCYFTH